MGSGGAVGSLLRRRLPVAGLLTLTGLLIGVGCVSAEQPRETAGTATAEPPTATTARPTPTPISAPGPEGETLTVTSAADSGPGTLRQLLLDAQPGDTITFDAVVFPPDDPQTIAVESALPQIVENYLTIDASDAGVILDGSQLPKDSWIPGLEVLSDHNTVRGLQVVNFTGTGIAVAGGRNNTIGGDRSVGRGPVGQGNLTSGNDFGIGVWDPGAGANVVTGNLIGTDIHGAPDLGNASSGVWITEGATLNKIGPDNIIAFSGRCGIEVDGSSSLRNTITRNSVQNSGYQGGICLLVGGNTGLAAPLVTDIDVSAGLVSGTACAGCAVEVFSDEGDEGATYEGQTTADSSGIFTFDKSGGFANTNITLTAADAESNTSEFSRPVGSTSGVLTLQEGNRRPKFALTVRPSSELADNRIGLAYSGSGLWIDSHSQLDGIVRDITDVGAKRVDTSLYELEPPIDWDVPEYHIPPEFDRFVDDLADNGVVLHYHLHFWDKEGHGRGEVLSTPRFKSAEQVEDFVEYVRFVVRHFKGRVPYYTIWSEPDNCGQEGGIKCIEADDYIELARQVIPVIREEDPEAKVSIAPVVLFFERDFLPTVMSSDVAPMFDVVQWHGQYGVTPDDAYYRRYDYYYEYPSIVEEIRETAEAHGFQGEYWSTEMGWCSEEEVPPCENPDHPWGIVETDILAAKYFARGIVMHLGMDVAAGIAPQPHAPWSYPTIRHLNTIVAGATPASLAVNISGPATSARIQSYGFRSPGGEMLFAVWTDGTAVDEDSGMSASLTFPGTSAAQVVGIDVLYGFEQELTTDTDANGDLVIHDLLLKDYPTILRIHPTPGSSENGGS